MCGVMADGADHEGLAPLACHELRPFRRWPPRVGELSEFADMVDFDLADARAHLAPSRQEPIDQLLVTDGDRGWFAVGEDRGLLPLERNAAEPCGQRFPAVAFNGHLQALSRPVRCVDGGLVLACHLRHRGAMLAGERLQQRGLHDPAQPVESPDVAGQQVVVDQSPVLGPIGGDDGVSSSFTRWGRSSGLPSL